MSNVRHVDGDILEARAFCNPVNLVGAMGKVWPPRSRAAGLHAWARTARLCRRGPCGREP